MNVALIYGGRSAEHEVSINSAKTIEKILKRNLTPSIRCHRSKRLLVPAKQVQNTIDERFPSGSFPAAGYTLKRNLPILCRVPTHSRLGRRRRKSPRSLHPRQMPLAGCDTSAGNQDAQTLAQSIFDRWIRFPRSRLRRCLTDFDAEKFGAVRVSS